MVGGGGPRPPTQVVCRIWAVPSSWFRPRRCPAPAISDAEIEAVGMGFSVSRVLPVLVLALVLSSVLLPLAALDNSHSALAAIAFVQTLGSATRTTTGTATTITTTAAATAGDSIIATFAVQTTATTKVTCNDSAGNTYQTNVQVTNTTGSVLTGICSAHNITTLSAGATITITHPSSSSVAVGAAEFSGIASTTPLDQTGSATGNSTTPSATTTSVTTQASELVIGGFAVAAGADVNFTPGSGFTLIQSVSTGGG